MKKKVFCILLALSALLSASALGEALRVVGESTGTLVYPNQADPVYQYVYAYPLVEAAQEDAQQAAEAINKLYADEVMNVINFALPMDGGYCRPEEGLSETRITYEVTCSSDAFFSLLIRKAAHINGFDSLIYSGHVFAVHSEKPGNVITLPYLLGILAGQENDTWLQDRQTARADACVRAMVWERLQRRADDGELTLLPGMEEEWFGETFYPEEDFYLDADGEPVFFLQPGFVTVEEDGLVTFPITLAEIEDEL